MDKELIVKSIGGSHTVEATLGNHVLTIDKPKEYGGKDLGPDPYAYILSALGSCTIMTIQMYALRKKWPVGQIEVRLNHRKNYAVDCERCEEDEKAKLDQIERKIYIGGELSTEQIERLHEIAEMCPVHKTLITGVHINTVTQAS